MSLIVPSYVLKMDRAQVHLKVLTEEIETYRAGHPYSAVARGKGKRKKWHLNIDTEPDRRIGIIAADAIYNIRSGLDHLAAALVPSNKRHSMYFPIFWKGVWEASIPGESEERRKDRSQWISRTAEVAPGAIAILKGLQPDEAAHDPNKEIHFMEALNRLSNRDRHRDLPIIVPGITEPTYSWDLDGVRFTNKDPRTGGMFKNGAIIEVPEGGMNVQITGTAQVVIRIAQGQGDVIIPGNLDRCLEWVRNRAILPLSPFEFVTPTPPK